MMSLCTYDLGDSGGIGDAVRLVGVLKGIGVTGLPELGGGSAVKGVSGGVRTPEFALCGVVNSFNTPLCFWKPVAVGGGDCSSRRRSFMTLGTGVAARDASVAGVEGREGSFPICSGTRQGAL
jgi:hypothetical protein